MTKLEKLVAKAEAALEGVALEVSAQREEVSLLDALERIGSEDTAEPNAAQAEDLLWFLKLDRAVETVARRVVVSSEATGAELVGEIEAALRAFMSGVVPMLAELPVSDKEVGAIVGNWLEHVEESISTFWDADLQGLDAAAARVREGLVKELKTWRRASRKMWRQMDAL